MQSEPDNPMRALKAQLTGKELYSLDREKRCIVSRIEPLCKLQTGTAGELRSLRRSLFLLKFPGTTNRLINSGVAFISYRRWSSDFYVELIAHIQINF